MPSQQTLDVVQRGQELYRDKLQTLLEANHPNQFVAIEPDSGDYFLGDTLSAAIGAARQAHPNRLAYALRIGHPAAVHLGVMATRMARSTLRAVHCCRCHYAPLSTLKPPT